MIKNILIAGGSGMIGSHLAMTLQQAGYQTAILTRSPDGHKDRTAFQWDTSKNYMDPQAIRWADALINLAGAGIADKRWTDERKKLILESRVLTTRLLVEKFTQSDEAHLQCVIQASAVGIYGHDEDHTKDESSPVGDDFLADVCVAWEAAAHEFTDAGIRTCMARIGVVQDLSGGMLARLLPLFRMRFAHYFGAGRQVYSWIHIDDISHSLIHLLESDRSEGVYNLTAPHPESARRFAVALQEALGHKGPILPMPALLIRGALGAMAQVVTEGVSVIPARLEQEGYTFRHPHLHEALVDLLKQG